jgi:hypothetical protein
MHLISTLLSLLLAFTFTSAIPVSEITGSATPILTDVDSILTDIGSISSDVVALRNIVIAWNGNVLGLAALELLLQQIGTDITAAAYAIASSGPFNLTDSNSILSAVTALVPMIVTLLGDLDAIVSLVIN